MVIQDFLSEKKECVTDDIIDGLVGNLDLSKLKTPIKVDSYKG